eukprot:gnl/Trimastix_PCT/4509.p1 GENE.gnl/Trimastix_PCT/4509~~gnl/Trimastix_PCT/4509.p1  ORF type:complete len:164 (-),score=28.76 gnl/Trimastix_PCT/4509:149-640(-)
MASRMEERPNPGSVPFDVSTHVGADHKNTTKIRCPRCNDLVLLPGKATLVDKSMFIPVATANDGETLNSWWSIPSMMTFENITFSKSIPLSDPLAARILSPPRESADDDEAPAAPAQPAIGTQGKIQFLSCCLCEHGPFGLMIQAPPPTGMQFYIAPTRVNYE